MHSQLPPFGAYVSSLTVIFRRETIALLDRVVRHPPTKFRREI